MNLNKHSRVRTVGLSCFLALAGFFGIAVFCPFNGGVEETHAADITKNGNISIDFVLQKVATGNISIDFLLAPLLSVSIDNLPANTSQTYNPTSATAAAVTQTAQFSVSSNSTAGYGVFVYGDSATLNGSNGHKINALSGTPTLSTMSAGTWGYNLKAGNNSLTGTETFNAMPTTKGTAAATGGVVTNQAYTLTFGAKVGYETYADTYTNNVKVQVVASGATTTNLSETNELRNAVIEQMEEDKQALEEAENSQSSEEASDEAVTE